MTDTLDKVRTPQNYQFDVAAVRDLAPDMSDSTITDAIIALAQVSTDNTPNGAYSAHHEHLVRSPLAVLAEQTVQQITSSVTASVKGEDKLACLPPHWRSSHAHKQPPPEAPF